MNNSLGLKLISIFLFGLLVTGCGGGIGPGLSDDVAKEIVRQEYRYAHLGLWIGVALIVIGVLLVVFGVVGSTSFVATFTGGSISVSDAPFGVALIVVGLFVVYITRPNIKYSEKDQ